MAPPPSRARVQIALPAPLSRRVAGALRLLLSRRERYRCAVARISEQGIRDFPARLLRRGRPHALAGNQGRQAPSGESRSLIIRGCLASTPPPQALIFSSTQQPNSARA